MYSVVEIGILNAIAAAAFALVVLLVSCFLKRPAIIHVLWVLVLLKFVTPPVVEIPLGWRLERLASLAGGDERPETRALRGGDSRSTNPGPAVIVYPDAADAPGDLERSTIAPGTDAALGGPVVVAGGNASRGDRRPAGAATRAVSNPDRLWSPSLVLVLLGAWAAGSLAWFAVQGWRIALFSRFVSAAQPASAAIQEQARQIAAQLGMRRAPAIWVLDATMSPMLWAVGRRARVIFPAALLDRVDARARATLLTHELAHYHRRDHWVRILELAVTGLFWWHPVVWLARREIEKAEEHCCDAWVVSQFPGQPRRYAEALLDTIDFLSEGRPRMAPASSGLGHAPFLRRRIRMIMSGVAPKSMSVSARLAVIVAATVLLPLGPQLFGGAIGRAESGTTRMLGRDAPAMALSPASRGKAGAPLDPIADAEPAVRRALARPEFDDPADLLEIPATAEAAVWAVVHSPDGRFHVAAGTDGGLVLRDTFQQRSFDLTGYQISSISFVRQRDVLAAGSADSHVYLFDCSTGEPVTRFQGHGSGIGSVAVSLDGRFLVSGSRDGAVKLWDLEDESELPSRVPRQANAVNCVRFSPDGRLIAIASGDWMSSGEGTVVLWDVRGGTIKQEFETRSPVGALAFGAGELVAAEWSGRTTSRDLQTGAARELGGVNKDTVSAAALAADAQTLLLAAARGEETAPLPGSWFHRMDRDGDGSLAWNEFVGPRGTFRTLDADGNSYVTQDEIKVLMVP